jgi:hypothetical protein
MPEAHVYRESEIDHIGVSEIRRINVTRLRKMRRPIMVHQSNATPLVVFMPYEDYIAAQETIINAIRLVRSSGGEESK